MNPLLFIIALETLWKAFKSGLSRAKNNALRDDLILTADSLEIWTRSESGEKICRLIEIRVKVNKAIVVMSSVENVQVSKDGVYEGAVCQRDVDKNSTYTIH